MISDYPVLKIVHVGCAAASYTLFLLRGIWMMRDSPLRRRRWARIVPHVNDTVLLAAAIALVALGGYHPLRDGWLAAKIVALLVYIALGMVALRDGRDRRTRVAAWLAAQLVFLYIVAVALTRDPLVLS